MTTPIRKAVIGCLALLFTFAMPMVALSNEDDSAIASVTVSTHDQAVLSAWISSLAMGEHDPEASHRQTTTGSTTITVLDSRGTASGWSVTISGSDLALSNLMMSDGEVVAVPYLDQPTNDLPESMAIQPVTVGPQQAMIAFPGEGAGRYLNSRQVKMIVPTGTSVEHPNATIIVTITGTNPGMID